MNFALANKTPVGVKINGTDYLLPRMTRRQWGDWAALVDSQRLAEATANLTPAGRAQVLTLYPIAPVETRELSRRVFTPGGTEHIIRTCCKAGKVPDDVTELLMNEGDPRDLETLAITLASLIDPQTLADAAKDETTEGAPVDPLARSGSESTDSATTA